MIDRRGDLGKSPVLGILLFLLFNMFYFYFVPGVPILTRTWREIWKSLVLGIFLFLLFTFLPGVPILAQFWKEIWDFRRETFLKCRSSPIPEDPSSQGRLKIRDRRGWKGFLEVSNPKTESGLLCWEFPWMENSHGWRIPTSLGPFRVRPHQEKIEFPKEFSGSEPFPGCIFHIFQMF